ncbi:MAG: cupin domain-containing protein [Acidimicrobiia bacterium]
MRRIGIPVILGALAALLAGAVAVATPSAGVALTELARADSIEPFSLDAQGDNDVIVLKATIEPGGTTGWHSHPGLEIAVVKAGTLTVYNADCLPRTVTAGHGRVQHAKTIHMGRNEGSEPVELYATFVVPHGSPVRVDENPPQGCSVPG